MSNSYVYILSNGVDIKIGKANDVKKRIAQLQTGSSTVFSLLGVIKCNGSKEAFDIEKELHTKLAPYKTLNEWFPYKFNSVQELDTRITHHDDVEPPYVKLYFENIPNYLYDLPSSTGSLIYELLNYVTYGTQEITLNAAIKKRIALATSISVRTLDNKLQELVKKGILDRVENGLFTLNPYLFGRGDWKTILELRNKNIHLEIVYDKTTGERKIKGAIDE